MALGDCIVRVESRTEDGRTTRGTGLLVSSRGHVATCNHVVDGADRVAVQLPYEPPWKYKVLGASEQDDIAILESLVAPTVPTRHVQFHADAMQGMKPGDLVRIYGHSAADHYSGPQVHRLTISGFSERHGRIGLSGNVNPGDSGGPVFTGDEILIGLVQVQDPERAGHAMAVPVDRLLELLDRLGMTPHLRESRTQPEKLSTSRMPVTGPHVFGRSKEIAQLDEALRSDETNIVSLVAWGGVGKTAIMNHWLREMGAEFGDAERVYAWSFYSQGTETRAPSGDVFVDAALSWFGDPDPTQGTAWQKGERLAGLVRKQRTILLLDGLEPLQYPPGPQEGRLRDQSVQALLRELAISNNGICVISTRLAVNDLAEFEGSSALRIDLEHLPPVAGAQVLKALGVKGSHRELAETSEEFDGHCLALTLLASYLTDVFDGDVDKRHKVGPLELDVRRGGHARRVMNSYKIWLGEGPETNLLHVLGLFDRPAEPAAIRAVCSGEPIPGLTEHLHELGDRAWRQVESRLRRARLLSTPDPDKPDHLDTHPLTREHFGEELQATAPEAWRRANRRLFEYAASIAEEFPETIDEMEPLFQAVIFGCRAGRETDAFHNVYLRRIMRTDQYYAVYKFGTLGPLLAVLSQFFEESDWSRPIEPNPPERQGLVDEDKLHVLTHVGWFLTATISYGALEVEEVFTKARSFVRDDDGLFPILRGLWTFHLVRANIDEAYRISERLLTIAKEREKGAQLVEAYMALAVTSIYHGNFRRGREHIQECLSIYNYEEHRLNALIYGNDPGVLCLAYDGFSLWLLGYPETALKRCADALELGEKVGHPFSLTLVFYMFAMVHQACGDIPSTRASAERLIEFCLRQGSRHFLTHGHIFRAWCLYAEGDREEGIRQMEVSLEEHLKTGAIVTHAYHIALLSDALAKTGRTSRGLELVAEALSMIDEHGDRRWEAELYRVRGDLILASSPVDETKALESFERAVEVSRRQDAKSLELRATVRIARLLAKCGSMAEGASRLREVYDWFKEGHEMSDLAEAASLLGQFEAS